MYFDDVAQEARRARYRAIFREHDVNYVHAKLEEMGPHPPFDAVQGLWYANPRTVGSYVYSSSTGEQWEYAPNADRTRWVLVKHGVSSG